MRFPFGFWLTLLTTAAAFALGPDDAPPRDVRLVEKKITELSNQDSGDRASKALAIEPNKWKHAETEHFILHYRRATEAQKVAREIEFDLWFVARSLGASKEQYAKKSHVYIFGDQKEWLGFVYQVDVPKWTSSFAHGDELFLHVGGAGEGFESDRLAHETTHAVVARLYPGRRWPRWLNEGFAEYMSTASLAARTKTWTKGLQKEIDVRPIPLEQLVTMTDYPEDREEVRRFYQTSEKVVRFLMNEYPKELFPKFVEVILNGTPLEQALPQVYSAQVKDFADFQKQYARK